MTQLSCQGAAINAARPRSSAKTTPNLPRSEHCDISQNASLRWVLDEIERIHFRDELHARKLVADAIAAIGAMNDVDVLDAEVPHRGELEHSASASIEVRLRNGLTTAGRSSPDNFPPIHLTTSRP